MFLNRSDVDFSAPAIKDGHGNSLSYLQLENMAKEYKADVKPRSLVMILCDYDIDTVAFYYCMLVNRVVPMLVDRHLDKGLLNRLIAAYKPQYIWKPIDMEKETVIRKNNHILIGTDYKPIGIYKDLALLLTTSGSTGSSKFVRISYGNIVGNARALSAYLQLRQDDIAITTLPFYYCYGLSVMHMHWHVGATVCITEKSIIQKEFWEIFNKAKATNFASVPYHYEILEKLDFVGKTYPSLRFLTVAGSKLPRGKQEYFGKALREKNIRFYMMYGQTEGTTVLSGVPYDKILDKFESAGVALPGLAASIDSMDEDGIGELVFCGDSVSMGYAHRLEELKKGDTNHGILHTGDVACMDAEGYIYLKGRIKRFVKVLGARISLDDLESIVQSYLPGGKAACVGTDNNIVVFYEGNVEESGLKKDIIKKCSMNAKMITVKKIKEIPRNPYGKVMYAKLQEQMEGDL